MKDWNVVVTVREHAYSQVSRVLRTLGRVDPTTFFNVLVMKVDDPNVFLSGLGRVVAETPEVAGMVTRVFPAERCFDFTNSAEFGARAREIAIEWAPRLAGKTFHVRVHRRERERTLSSVEEERHVADALLAALDGHGTPGRISFDDPDATVLIDTVDGRAGMMIGTREDVRRYPFLAV